MQFVLATRHLERIADHATNIAEDIIFWVRGLDVRHGRGLAVRPEEGETYTTAAGATSSVATPPGPAPSGPTVESEVTNNSSALHADVTQGCETQRV
jgi:hypothetical protein